MDFKLIMPDEVVLIKRSDLREVIKEIVLEIHNDSENEEIFTIKEAADYLKVSVPTVRKMIANRDIPYFQWNQVIRLKRSELRIWLEKNDSEIS